MSYRGTPLAHVQIHAFIERACDPMLPQPDLGLNLEIADLINQKKANTPREAAFKVVELINSRNQHISMLALSLLDILVKNCSYPIHLQISTKEFLNELVRRFPEKPPIFPPPPMAKILEMIHEWKNTLCVGSKYKEDLVHIRDMHRLLSYKGYRFPTFDKRAAHVLNPTESLKSQDEMEEEDRAAQSAKLQELIRRGTPKDLQAAQELMKVMAGAEPDKKPDYATQVAKELDRVQHRILLLNEMLNSAQPGEKFVKGDSYDQVAGKCRNIQPKLQKWIAEAAENDPDSMERLLLINDMTNNVLQRYEAFKKGDFSATVEINPAVAGSQETQAATKEAAKNLIDFDEPEQQPPPALAEPSSSPQPSGSGGGLDDLNDSLVGLSFGGATSAPSTSAAATASTGTTQGQKMSNAALVDLFAQNTTQSSSTANFFSQPQQQNQNAWSNLTSPPSTGATNGTGMIGIGVGASGSNNAFLGTPTGGVSSAAPLPAAAGGGGIFLPNSRPASAASNPRTKQQSPSGIQATIQPSSSSSPSRSPPPPSTSSQQQTGKDPFGDLLDLKF